MKFIKKNVLFITLTIFIFFVFALPVSYVVAQNGNSGNPSTQPQGNSGDVDPEKGRIHNPLGDTTDIPELIQKALQGALKIGVPIVALAIIYSGFLFVFAMGNPEKLKKAKDALLYTLIGAAILLGSWAIATLIVTTVRGLG